MVSIRQLRFQYPGSSFSLQVDRLDLPVGHATAVVGPSGCGKTTFLHLLAGIHQATSGSIRVGDTDVTQLSEADRRAFRLSQIGFIFQNFELIDYLNVLDNVLLPCRVGTAVKLDSTTRDRAAGLLQQAGLANFSKRNVTQLSQGERQRVALCRALLVEPSLLLADEPTGNLDPETSEQVLNLLFEFIRQNQTTFVMVTHDHSLLHRFDQTVDFRQLLAPVGTEAVAEP
ncbi:MAG: ABC transporter ATP-binding protein [Fuerstiella sp.]